MLPSYSPGGPVRRKEAIEDNKDTVYDNNLHKNIKDQSEKQPSSLFRFLFKYHRFLSLIIIILAILLLLRWLSYSHHQKTFTTTGNAADDNVFQSIALLLTDPDQSKEGSYGWYRDQLNKNRLGNAEFENPFTTTLGFQDTWVTGESMFHYFRTFNTKEKCLGQATSKIYADKTAGEFQDEYGVDLDAVLVHGIYGPPFFLNREGKQTRTIGAFHSLIQNSSTNLDLSILDRSNQIDHQFGEWMWKGMRRLSIFMCNEAVVVDQVHQLAQHKSNVESMERFAKSTADISVCFLSTCSVWVNYLYWDINTSKSKKFGTKSFSKNKGICAFISNCDSGTDVKERYAFLTTLAKYIPVKQFGKCGNKAKEGPDGKKFEIENNCRFYFAAENSITKDYVTEKFFEGIRAIENGAKMLMIYRGASNIKELGFPSSMFINHDDFESVDTLGQYLKKLNENDEAFETRFAKISMDDRINMDEVLNRFNYKLGSNIPCRITKIIGDMKLARYLLFKIGLSPTRYKVNFKEWDEFKAKQFPDLETHRLDILDNIYFAAYQIFQSEGNNKNMYGLGWKFQ